MSGLRLDNGNAALQGGASGPVIKPGHSADSPLVLRVSGAKGFGQMPPAGPKLSSEQIGLIRAWIDQGAHWPGADNAQLARTPQKSGSSHWAFQPIQKPAAPQVSDANWVRNPIDAFVLARLEREKIKPSPEAPRPVLATPVEPGSDRPAADARGNGRLPCRHASGRL